MTCDSSSVRFWEEREASRLFRWRPCTAAATLPAAIMEGGLAMNLTSAKKREKKVRNGETKDPIYIPEMKNPQTAVWLIGQQYCHSEYSLGH